MPNFEDQVILITGGTSGIGFATAQEFSARGATVVITGQRDDEVQEAAARLGENVVGIRADISKGDEMDALYEEIESRFGRLDHVIANAGSGHHSVLGRITEEEFDTTFAVNGKGTLNTVQKALPILKPGASILIIGSTGSIQTPYGMSIYSGAKAALRAFVRGWIQDIKGSGIRLNVLSPGAINTESLRDALAKAVGPDGVDAAVKVMGEGNPMGRVGEPREIAKAIAFMTSEEASFVHGVELFVDGGMAQV
jgi:NAD(P)-dependent dehydrogenase (short-subunit alcohol dehydrogenase family)